MSAMMGYATDWQVDQWIGLMLGEAPTDTGEHWASLHFANPSGPNPTATEIPGATYTRQQVLLAVVGNRALQSTNAQAWRALSETTVTHLGLWDSPYGGNLRAIITLVNPWYITEGASHVLAAGELYIRWP